MMASNRSSATSDIGILLAAGPAGKISDAALGVPAILLPLHERSLLQRAVEHLVRSGCRQIHVALGNDATQIKDFLRTGERWGCQMRYHYVDPQESLGRFVRRLDLDQEHRYWLADAMQVPRESLPVLTDPAAEAGRPLCWNDGTQLRWAGWGLYTGAFLRACEKAPADESMERLMLSAGGLSPHNIERPLSATTLADLLDGSRRLLAAQANPVIIGRNSQIHPAAKIIAPVFIGTCVKVAAGAVIGPNVAIESGAFIDQNAYLRDSVVMSDTYVGEELDMHGIIVRGRLLANISLNVVTEIPDPTLLAVLIPERQPAMHRMLGGVLCLALAPMYGLSLWQNRIKRDDQPRVTIPLPRGSQSQPGQVDVNLALPEARPGNIPQRLSEHFCRTFYPGLREVVRGHLQLVGPTPRSAHVVRQLPPEWRDLYHEYRCGLLNEGLLQGAATTPEDQFASDALACAGQGDLRATLKLLRRYLGLLLRDIFNASPAGLTRSATTAPFGAGGENTRITHRPI
jgi:CTP:molybdopterin cytidylyltransferase MocA